MTNPNTLSAALPLYVGYGLTGFPKEDGSRLVEVFGPELGSQLETEIKQLLVELDQLKPDWDAHTLVSASKWASASLRHKYPGLDQTAVASLEWVFSWWWR